MIYFLISHHFVNFCLDILVSTMATSTWLFVQFLDLCLMIIWNVKFVSSERSFIIGSVNLSNWTQSKLFCQQLGSTLASIHSESDYTQTKEICTGNNGCWIGLNDIDSEGIWKWDDDSFTDYGFINNNNTNPTTGIHPWKLNQPNNYLNHSNDNENCVQINNIDQYKWNDNRCSDLYYPICNIPTTEFYQIYYHHDDHCDGYFEYNQTRADYRYASIVPYYPRIMLLNGILLKKYALDESEEYINICYNESQQEYLAIQS